MCVTTDDPTVGKPLQSEAGLSLSEWRWAHHVGATWRANGSHRWHAQVAFQKTQVQPHLRGKCRNTAQKSCDRKITLTEIKGKAGVVMSLAWLWECRLRAYLLVLCLSPSIPPSFCAGPWMRLKIYTTCRGPVNPERFCLRTGLRPTPTTWARVLTGRALLLWGYWRQCTSENGDCLLICLNKHVNGQ